MAHPKSSEWRLVEVDLNVTHRCNLHCDFCSVLVRPVGDRSRELSLDELTGLFRQFTDLGVEVVRIVGGEPFARRDILEILRMAGQFPLRTSVLTNGTMMTRDQIAASRDAGIEHLAFSVDGPIAELHDRSRGKRGAFKRLVEMVEACNELNMRHRMMTAVTAATVPFLRELVEFADYHRFELLNFISLGLSGGAVEHRSSFPTYGDWSRAFVELTLFIRDRQPDVWVSHLFPHEDPVPLEMYLPLEEAGLLHLLRDVWLIDHEGYDPRQSQGMSRCEAGHNGVTILPNGDVFGCDLMQGIPDLKAGNVLEQELSEIFHGSPLFARLRASPDVRGCARFSEDSTDYSCGQCRAGVHNLVQGAPLTQIRVTPTLRG